MIPMDVVVKVKTPVGVAKGVAVFDGKVYNVLPTELLDGRPIPKYARRRLQYTVAAVEAAVKADTPLD